MTNYELTDRVAIVTGGASGIGRKISLELADGGADVVIADLQRKPREGGTPTDEVIGEDTEAEASYVECDVTNKDALADAIAAAEEFGGVNVMVNNAGIFRSEEFTETEEAFLDQMLAVNVKGSFFGAQLAIREMLEGDGGTVINLSSIAGLRGSGEFVTYTMTKGAVRLMTYSLAAKYGGEGIRVNAVHPGIIETTMTTEDVPLVGGESGYREAVPMGRFGQPEEIAAAVRYLASDASSYVNGESLVVDGGFSST